MRSHLAATLLRDHRKKVALSVARQMINTIPRYESVGVEVLYRSTDQLLRALIKYLETHKNDDLDPIIEDMIQLRRLSGFSPAELLMAGMCFFPVLRRFFIRKAERSRLGLELYDEVEKALFPVFVRMAVGLSSSNLSEESAWTNLKATTLPNFQIEEVEGDEIVGGGDPFDPSFS